MFDLIGFWAGVTIYVVPLVFYSYLFFESIAREEVAKITNGKYKWGPWKKWLDNKSYSERNSINDWVGISFMVSLVNWVVTVLFWISQTEDEKISFIGVISVFCETVSPITGTLALIGTVWAVYVLIIRKGLIGLFNLKEKVDKL